MSSKNPAIMQMCRQTGRTTRMLHDYLDYTRKNNTDDGIILVASMRDGDRIRAMLSKITNTPTARAARIVPLDEVIVRSLIHSGSSIVDPKTARTVFGSPSVQLFIDHAAIEVHLGWVVRTYHHWDQSLRLEY